jgi:hypothetical protein
VSGGESVDRWRGYVRSRLPELDIAAEREFEIVEELAHQLDATCRAALAGGVDEAAARARAEAEVGDWNELARTLVRIERPVAARVPAGVRPSASAPALGPNEGGAGGGVFGGLEWWRDLRYAARTLRRTPGFAAVAIATLALGIGATTLVYSLVDGVLLRPLPFREPDRVVRIVEVDNAGTLMSLAWLDFVDLQEQAKSYEGLAGWAYRQVNLTKA